MAEHVMAVGGLNRTVPYFADATGIGLTLLGFDDQTGAMTRIREEASVDNGGFLSAHPSNGAFYVNTEMGGWHEGVVSAYRYDPAARCLRYLNKQPTLGSTPAYNSVTPDGSSLLLVNYAMEPVGEGPDQAVVVFPIRPDGGLDPAASSVRQEGTGPDLRRQERSHPHCIRISPTGDMLFVADLGIDAILAYRFETDRRIGPIVGRTALPPGAGPRHLLFHPAGTLLVLVCELHSTLTTFRYRPGSGELEKLYEASLLPEGYAGETYAADLKFHPGGRTLYASNRGHDSIAVFGLDPETGALALLGHRASGGATPRNLAIDPSGRFLLVANQDSSLVSAFRISGARHETLVPAAAIKVGSPMCICFLPTAGGEGA